MNYTEKVKIYNKFTKHYTRPMLQTEENIMYFPQYIQISQHGESQQNMSQFSCYYSSVHNTVSSVNNKHKIRYPVQVTITKKQQQQNKI